MTVSSSRQRSRAAAQAKVEGAGIDDRFLRWNRRPRTPNPRRTRRDRPSTARPRACRDAPAALGSRPRTACPIPASACPARRPAPDAARPPATNSARASWSRAAADSPSSPSSPIPTMDSQGVGMSSLPGHDILPGQTIARPDPRRHRRRQPAGGGDRRRSDASMRCCPMPAAPKTRSRRRLPGALAALAASMGWSTISAREHRACGRRHPSFRGANERARDRGLRRRLDSAAGARARALAATSPPIAGSRSMTSPRPREALGAAPRRVFLGIGRQHLAPVRRASAAFLSGPAGRSAARAAAACGRGSDRGARAVRSRRRPRDADRPSHRHRRGPQRRRRFALRPKSRRRASSACRW